MNFCKLINYDIRKGTLKFNRYPILMLISVLQCMLVQVHLNNLTEYSVSLGIENCQYTLREMLLGVFAGCDPFFKIGMGTFPYAWFAMYACVLFITFDYLHLDISQSGIQVLTRSQSRVRWWISKCIWNIVTVFLCYVLIVFLCIIFCYIVHIPIAFEHYSEMTTILSLQSSCYTANESLVLEIRDMLFIIFLPFITMTALSLLQMVLSLIFKPIVGISFIIGCLVLSFLVDWIIAFPRTGMLLYNSIIYKDGYAVEYGISICLIVIVSSIVLGAVIIRKIDLLSYKEAE